MATLADQAARLIERGMSVAEICAELKIDNAHLSRVCKISGLRLPRKSLDVRSSATVDRIRELAAAGRCAVEIASELSLSRQRVYQAAKTHHIPLPRPPIGLQQYVYRRQVAPVPRVTTGGIVQPINQSTAGTIAELLAAADLMARGWNVFMPVLPSRGHGLIISKGETIITIEVRSAHRHKTGRLTFAKRTDEKSSTFALVVTGEPVSYLPPLPE